MKFVGYRESNNKWIKSDFLQCGHLVREYWKSNNVDGLAIARAVFEAKKKRQRRLRAEKNENSARIGRNEQNAYVGSKEKLCGVTTSKPTPQVVKSQRFLEVEKSEPLLEMDRSEGLPEARTEPVREVRRSQRVSMARKSQPALEVGRSARLLEAKSEPILEVQKSDQILAARRLNFEQTSTAETGQSLEIIENEQRTHEIKTCGHPSDCEKHPGGEGDCNRVKGNSTEADGGMPRKSEVNLIPKRLETMKTPKYIQKLQAVSKLSVAVTTPAHASSVGDHSTSNSSVSLSPELICTTIPNACSQPAEGHSETIPSQLSDSFQLPRSIITHNSYSIHLHPPYMDSPLYHVAQVPVSPERHVITFSHPSNDDQSPEAGIYPVRQLPSLRKREAENGRNNLLHLQSSKRPPICMKISPTKNRPTFQPLSMSSQQSLLRHRRRHLFPQQIPVPLVVNRFQDIIENMQSPVYKPQLSTSPYYQMALYGFEYHINQVSKGKDAYIYVENTVDEDLALFNFTYTSERVFGANVRKPLPRGEDAVCICRKGQCVNDRCRCCRNHDSAGYFKNGRIKKIHLGTLVECCDKCGCDRSCGNRIVQQGCRTPLCIFKTRDKGWGVKAVEPIPKGTFVSTYVGEVITDEEAETRGKDHTSKGITYLFDMDYTETSGSSNEEIYTIDATYCGNLSRFFNHSVSRKTALNHTHTHTHAHAHTHTHTYTHTHVRIPYISFMYCCHVHACLCHFLQCSPNMSVCNVWIETLDAQFPHLAFFLSRDVAPQEELCFNYMITCNTSVSGVNSEPCQCGARNCKGVLW